METNKLKSDPFPITRKTRRKMAIYSLYSIMVVTLLCIFCVDVSRLKVLGEIISWFYIIMGSIVGSYMGFATFDEKWKREKKGKDEE